MTTNKSYIESLAALAATLPDRIDQLDAIKSEIETTMDALKKKGLIYASVHMKGSFAGGGGILR